MGIVNKVVPCLKTCTILFCFACIENKLVVYKGGFCKSSYVSFKNT